MTETLRLDQAPQCTSGDTQVGGAPSSVSTNVGLLPQPVPIGHQSWPEGTEPLISICCITYNHGPFIRQCLDGFLIQETTFPVEILIHDDASTDDTAAVIREYAARYPRLFKPILQTENQYSKGVKPHVTFNLPRARGRYIAICEGDDFWSSPEKLARQVEVLEAHPEYVGCFHDVEVLYQDGSRAPHAMLGPDARVEVSLENLLERNGIPTLSVMYRAGLQADLPPWYHQMPFGDWPMHILNAQHGRYRYLPALMATYRVHRQGAWSGIGHAAQMRNTVKVLEAVDRHLQHRHHGQIARRVARCHYEIAHALSGQGSGEALRHLAKSVGHIGRGVPAAGVLRLAFKHTLPWLYARTYWRLEQMERWLRG